MTAHADEIRVSAFMRTAVVAAAMFALVTAARAGEVADKAEEAEELLGAGEVTTAFETLDTAVDEFWTIAPLTLARAEFVSKRDVEGKFARREDKPFAPGDRLEIFLEPVGYGFSRSGGTFGIKLTPYIEIRTPSGLILGKSQEFSPLQWSGPVRNRSFTGTVGIDMPDLKPGDYEIYLTLTDQASQKSTDTALPFTVPTE